MLTDPDKRERYDKVNLLCHCQCNVVKKFGSVDVNLQDPKVVSIVLVCL